MATDYLADPNELAGWLGVPADTPKLLAALKAATRRFRGAVGHPMDLVIDDEVTLDGNGRESLLLPVWPTTTVTSVAVDGEVLVEGMDYSWSEAGMLRRLGYACWPDRLRCVDVVYSHGFGPALEDIPQDVQEAVIDQARTMFTVVPGVQSRAVGGQSVTFGATAAVGVSDQWSKAVARYKVRTGSDL